MLDMVILKLSGKAIPELLSNHQWIEVISTLQKKHDGVVLVHGAGNEISEWSKQLGMTSEFIDGQRVTPQPVMEIVAAVQSGLINGKIVAHLGSYGFDTMGLTGSDRNLFTTEVINPLLGFVGYPKPNSSSEWIFSLLMDHVIPVFSSVCKNNSGQLINVNADIFTEQLAILLGCKTVYFISDISGIIFEEKVADKLPNHLIETYIRNGQITQGMIPKVRSMNHLLENNIDKVWIGPSDPIHLLETINQTKSFGTWIIKETEKLYE